MDLPIYNEYSKLGEDGITILKRIIETDLKWIFRLNHLEHDFGIDAYIDVITDIGQVTGKTIAAQVKSGDSYFEEKNDFGWVYRGKMSHLNYYLNHDIPVLIILVDVNRNKAFWCHCDPNLTEQAGENWKITVPFAQVLKKESKVELIRYISPIKDYASQLENFWNLNRELKKSEILALVVDKPEIVNLYYDNMVIAFKRLQVNPELMRSMKGKVDIWIHGYNDDPRELFEITEVKVWINTFLSAIDGWSYFLSTDNGAGFIRIAQLCNMKYTVLKDSEYLVQGKKKRKLEIDLTSGGPFLDLFFEDLNSFCDKYKIGIETNREITENLVMYLSGLKD